MLRIKRVAFFTNLFLKKVFFRRFLMQNVNIASKKWRKILHIFSKEDLIPSFEVESRHLFQPHYNDRYIFVLMDTIVCSWIFCSSFWNISSIPCMRVCNVIFCLFFELLDSDIFRLRFLDGIHHAFWEQRWCQDPKSR